MKKASHLVSFFRSASTGTRNGSASIKAKALKSYISIYQVSAKRPITSFLIALAVLLAVIIAANTVAKPKTAQTPPSIAKNVDTYTIGQAPTVKVQAQVTKDGVVQIIAQTPGIVQKISVKEGDSVTKGANLLSLSTNYQGGNAASLSRQLAQYQYQNVNDTYDKQKDIISKQRDLTNKGAENTEDLRKISVDSLNDTNSLLNLNQDIVNTLNSNLANLIATNVGGANDPLILATKQQISSFQAAVNGLNSASRSLGFSTNTTNPPAQIANITKDLTLEQLDIQERALDLSKKISQIQLNLAQVNEALMFPASPSSGTVQKVYVMPGQSVSPGTPLVTIYNAKGNIQAIVKLPQSIARSVSRIENSTLTFDNKAFDALPTFVSQEATDGQLYSVLYDIPEEFQEDLTNKAYISVEIPLGLEQSPSANPFIPLDAVFQTQDHAYVYVVDGGKAAAKTVELGNVVGNDVEVKVGLSTRDQIILNRNIVAGDRVVANQ